MESSTQFRAANDVSKTTKWSKEKVISEARRRAKELFTPTRTQAMLEALMEESGWTDEEFVDAMCQDVISRSSK